MTAEERILWNRNKDLTDKIGMLVRYMATVQYSPNHEAAIQASKDAFAILDANDPFAPTEAIQTTEEARRAS